MDDSKKVSIIMVFYNEQKYLAQAIQSVLESTYENLELILVNDGSHASRQQASKPEKYNRTMIDILEYAWKTRGFLLDKKDIEFIDYHAN